MVEIAEVYAISGPVTWGATLTDELIMPNDRHMMTITGAPGPSMLGDYLTTVLNQARTLSMQCHCKAKAMDIFATSVQLSEIRF
jgi:hypothetical protein